MAFLFSGSGQYLIQNKTSFASTAPVTFACWIKPNQVTAQAIPLAIGCNVVGHHSGFSVQTTAAAQGLCNAESDAGSNGSATGTLTMTVGNWYLLVGVFTSTTSRTVYVNGGNSGTNATSITLTPANVNRFIVGGNFNNGVASQLFNGAVAFPCVWSVALSASDVTNLYNSGLGADPRTIQAASVIAFSALNTDPPVETVLPAPFTVVGAPSIVDDPFSLTGIPILGGSSASSITVSSATLNGSITNIGVSNPTVVGFNWGLTNAYGNQISTSGSFGLGAFSQGLTPLAGGTPYHFQAFATNPNGTGFAPDAVFITTATSQATGEVLLNGNQIGTPGSFGGSGNVIANLLDANSQTLSDGPDSSGDWAGMDANVPVLLTRVRLSPRASFEDRIISSTIEANLSDPTFVSGNVTLLTFSSRPSTGTLVNEYAFNPGVAYRYFRYHAIGFSSLGDLDFICTYTTSVVGQIVQPVITPMGGQYDRAVVISMSSITTSAAIFYTTDGSTPTASSTLYTGPFTIRSSLPGKIVVSAIAHQPGAGLSDSRITTATFYVPSTFVSTDTMYDTSRNYRLWAVTPFVFHDPVSGWWYLYGDNRDQIGVDTQGLIGTNVYKSADLRNWTWIGLVGGPPAGQAQGFGTGVQTTTRWCVLYNAANNNYVAWAHAYTPDSVFNYTVYTATSPEGPFTAFTTYTSLDGLALPNGDNNVFVDSDGSAYLTRACGAGGSNNSHFSISLLSSDYKSTSGTHVEFSTSATFGMLAEAPQIFKRGSTYFITFSGDYVWQSGKDGYAWNLTGPLGSWTNGGNPFQSVPGGIPDFNTSYDGQVNKVVQVPGRDDGTGLGAFYILVDRYDLGIGSAGTSTTANFNAYVCLFIPIAFPTSTSMTLTWNNAWSFDSKFPTVSGAPLAASGLSVSSGVASWTNNEPRPANLYLDYAANAGFTSGALSEVISTNGFVSTYTAKLAVGPGFYRIRTVNASGTTNSTSFYIDPNKLPPVIAASTGSYVVLTIESSYIVEFLIAGVDYSNSIETIKSGPYQDPGVAFQALWTLLNPVFPLANPLPIPPPGPWS